MARYSRHYPQNVKLRTKRPCCLQLLVRVTDHCPILVPEAVGFFQELLPPQAQRKSQKNARISRIKVILNLAEFRLYARRFLNDVAAT